MSTAFDNLATLAALSTSEDPGSGGFWPDETGARIARVRDRLFVGEAADFTGNRTGTQGGFVPSSTEGANWAPRDSQLFVAASSGLIAVAGFSRSSDQDDTPTEAIGVAGFVINDKSSGRAWGLYADVQHESGALFSAGLEVASKNKGSNITGTPYGTGGGCVGLWLVGGGDASYGGSPTNPSNAAITILGNASTWNVGINFADGGLTKTGGVSNAVAMGVDMRLFWYTSGGAKGATIRSSNDTGSANIDQVFSANGLTWFGANSKPVASMSHTASAVNYISLASNVTTSAPQVKALGDDTNIDLALVPKGSGVVSFGAWTSNADAAVNGYVTIKDAAGNTRKLATIA